VKLNVSEIQEVGTRSYFERRMRLLARHLTNASSSAILHKDTEKRLTVNQNFDMFEEEENGNERRELLREVKS